MKSWNAPVVPRIPGSGPVPRVFDTASNALVEARPAGASAALYVCGITPYDATHIGHAATYIAFDTLGRLWRDAGYAVHYVQNTTDVDDPLLERAHRDGLDWRDLAAAQTDLFRGDMQNLAIIPPDHYVAVTEMIDQIADAVASFLATGTAYRVGDDVYFDTSAAERTTSWRLGDESRESRAAMLVLSAERGGDPDRPGKRDPLDPLLWRAERPGEPAWSSVVGRGRPGWHIECSVIAETFLDPPLTVTGGGRDLAFPHHEYSAAHTAALTGAVPAGSYVHSGLVHYRGEKMSKSLGNLVFVSRLIDGGADPRAIRLAILGQRYSSDWEWTAALLEEASALLARLTEWATAPAAGDAGVEDLRAILANDLDTPGALAFLDETPASAGLVMAVDALLGVRL